MKHRLLPTLDEGEAREAELVALCVDAPAGPDRRWSAKDHLAHLAWWRNRAAAGDARKALPLLRASFRDRPELIAHARKDPDLDRIRDDTAVKELLAT